MRPSLKSKRSTISFDASWNAEFRDSILPTRFRWSSNWEYLISHLMYTVYQYQNIGMALGTKMDFVPSILCIIIICLPIQYMQTALGQYSQSSGTHLRYVSPIAHGIGYSFLLITFIRIMPDAVVAGDSMLYFLNCMQSTLPWLNCDRFKNCWYERRCADKDAPCLSDATDLAASLYWNRTFMQNVPSTAQLTAPDIRRMITVALVWIVSYMIVYTTKDFSRLFLRYAFIVSLILRFVILVVMLIGLDGAGNGFNHIMYTSWASITNHYVWAKTLLVMMNYMAIGRGGSILLGSFFAPNSSSGILTVLGTGMCLFVYTIIFLVYYTATAVVAHAAKVSNPDKLILKSTTETVEFTLIPGGLGYTAVPQIWTSLYFIALVLHSMAHIIVNLRIIEISLEDAFPHLTKYRKYTLMGTLILNLIVSIVFVTKGFYNYVNVYLSSILDLFETFLILLMVFVIAWFYGVQRLCDDIHFIIGTQPTKFWKVTWYLSPVLILLSLIIYLYRVQTIVKFTPGRLMFITLIITILISPVIALALIEMFKFIRRRNLIGMCHTTADWGPVDPNERQMRHIFNPRKEIKSRRRNETCPHKCLLKSRILEQVITEESLYHYGEIHHPSLLMATGSFDIREFEDDDAVNPD